VYRFSVDYFRARPVLSLWTAFTIVTDHLIVYRPFPELAHGAGKVRTSSGVAARSGRLAAPGQREDRRGAHRSDRPDRRRFSREIVAPQGTVDRADKHDRRPHLETGNGFGLRHVTGSRLLETPSGIC